SPTARPAASSARSARCTSTSPPARSASSGATESPAPSTARTSRRRSSPASAPRSPPSDHPAPLWLGNRPGHNPEGTGKMTSFYAWVTTDPTCLDQGCADVVVLRDENDVRPGETNDPLFTATTTVDAKDG